MLMAGRRPGLSTPVGSEANGHGFNVTYCSGRGRLFPVAWTFKIKHGAFSESSHLFMSYKVAWDKKTTASKTRKFR